MAVRRLVALVVAGVALAVTPAAARSGGAASANRAVVVVELPSGETRSACVVFEEVSITGLELLTAAQMSPETYGMGPGAAVCKLCGEGCPRTRDGCLSCDGGKYWQYYRSDGGGEFSYSNVGAGNSEVTDGDVDGWRFGSDRQNPLLVAVDTVCSDPARTFRFERASSPSPASTAPPPTTAASPATSAPAPSSTVSRPAPVASRSTPTPTTALAGPAGAVDTTVASTTTTPALAVEPPGGATDRGVTEEAAPPAPVGRREAATTSSPVALSVFAALLALLAAGILRARVRRRRAIASPT